MKLETIKSYAKRGAILLATAAGAFLLYQAAQTGTPTSPKIFKPPVPAAGSLGSDNSGPDDDSDEDSQIASSGNDASSDPDAEAYTEKTRALMAAALRQLDGPIDKRLHQLPGQDPDGHLIIGDGTSDFIDWKRAGQAEHERLKCYDRLKAPDYDPGPCLSASKRDKPEIWQALKLQESLKMERVLSLMANGENPGEIQLENLITKARIAWGKDPWPDRPQAKVQALRREFLEQLEMIGRTEDDVRRILLQTASKCATLGSGSCDGWRQQFEWVGMVQDPETGEWSW